MVSLVSPLPTPLFYALGLLVEIGRYSESPELLRWLTSGRTSTKARQHLFFVYRATVHAFILRPVCTRRLYCAQS
jgi:hypothetical protein